MRENEYVIAIFAKRGVLHAQTMRFAGEVRSPKETGAPREQKPNAKLVQELSRALGKLPSKLDPSELIDPELEALRERLEQKRERGKDVIESAEVGPAPHAEIIDLMEVLKRNLQAARDEQGEPQPPRERAQSSRARSRGPDRPARTTPAAGEKRGARGRSARKKAGSSR
jgi:non-homologous end joining protein Ku